MNWKFKDSIKPLNVELIRIDYILLAMIKIEQLLKPIGLSSNDLNNYGLSIETNYSNSIKPLSIKVKKIIKELLKMNH